MFGLYCSNRGAGEMNHMNEYRKRAQRKPRPMTRERLERMAVHYLGRYPASVARFRKVMGRKLERSASASGDAVTYFEEWLTAVEQKCLRLGLLNDEAYAQGVARSLHRQGLALRAIGQRLRHKGVESETISAALSALKTQDGIDPDLLAAITFARKKRLGPWCSPELRRERYRKHLGAMARRGFSFGLSKRVLESEIDELDALVHENDGWW